MPKAGRVKIQCLVCSRVFDNDYRNRHNAKYHAIKLRERQSIPYRLHGTPLNPFKDVQSVLSRYVADSCAQQSTSATSMPSAHLQQLPAAQLSHVWSVIQNHMKETSDSVASVRSQLQPIKTEETGDSTACVLSQWQVRQRKSYTFFRKMRKPKRVKVQCLLCSRVFNNDYSNRHNARYHATLLQEQRSIPYKLYVAPPNSFKALARGPSRHVAGAGAQLSVLRAAAPSTQRPQLPAPQVSHVWPVKRMKKTCNSVISVNSPNRQVKMEDTFIPTASGISQAAPVNTKETSDSTARDISQGSLVKTEEATCASAASATSPTGPVVMGDACDSEQHKNKAPTGGVLLSASSTSAAVDSASHNDTVTECVSCASTTHEVEAPLDVIGSSAFSATAILASTSQTTSIVEPTPNKSTIEIATLLNDMLTALRQGIELSSMVSNPHFSAAYFCSSVKEFATKVQKKSHTILKACDYVMFDEFTVSDIPGENSVSCDPADRAHKELTDEQRLFIVKSGPQRPRMRFYPKNPEIDPKKQNTFCSKWLEEYPYLEYSQKADAAFCFPCSVFPRTDGRGFGHKPWVMTGVREWHKMKSRGVKTPGKLALHFNSDAHKMAVENLKNFVDKNRCAIGFPPSPYPYNMAHCQ